MHTSISISELNQLIKSALETQLEPTYWVVGELTDFRVAGAGHAYFELVEKSGNTVLAKIRGNLWSFAYREIAARFQSATGTHLKTGMKVLAQVAVSFHPLYGLSANVKDIDPSFSLGERARLRQETIDRLTQEGLLNLNASLALPQVLQKIAIISSPTAAGYGDFVQQIDRNSSGFKIYHKLYPAAMQGNEASASITEALKLIGARKNSLGIEAVVIIRGGGAQLDLDCFDQYDLAREIATFSLPVLTGIGHERDETIADLVAHTRLKTPTAVAEFILSSFREFEENLRIQWTRLERVIQGQLKQEQTLLEGQFQRLKSLGFRLNSSSRDKLQSLQKRLKSTMRSNLESQKSTLIHLEKNLEKSALALQQRSALHLTQIEKSLVQLDPRSILKRGYSRTEINGVSVDNLTLEVGQELDTYTSKNKIKSIIKSIENHG